MITTAVHPSDRLRSLDILRAIAVLLVLGYHMYPCPPAAHPALALVMDLWKRCGWIGVDLFFVLSGFLVAGLLFREQARFGSIGFGRFFVRRGFKIYPAFYLFLAVTIVVRKIYGGNLAATSILAEAVFLQNYLPPLWTHTWSLAVEEHFYLLLPPALILLARDPVRPFRRLPQWVAAVAVAALLARLATEALVPYSNRTGVFPTHLRLDSLAIGVLIAYGYHDHRPGLEAWTRAHRRALWASAVTLLSPTLFLDVHASPFLHTVGFTLVYLGFASVLLLTLLPGRMAPGPIGRLLAGVGFHSYSIYLWHMAVIAWINPFVRDRLGGSLPFLAELAVFVGGSVVIGSLLAICIERPFLAVRDRWFPSRSGALAAEPAAGRRPASIASA